MNKGMQQDFVYFPRIFGLVQVTEMQLWVSVVLFTYWLCAEVCSHVALKPLAYSSSAYFLPSREVICCHSVLYSVKTIYADLEMTLAKRSITRNVKTSFVVLSQVVAQDECFLVSVGLHNVVFSASNLSWYTDYATVDNHLLTYSQSFDPLHSVPSVTYSIAAE